MDYSAAVSAPLSYPGIALALLLYPLVEMVTIGYFRLPKGLHYDKSDLHGQKLEALLCRLDRLFGSRWVPPLCLTLLSLLAYPTLGWSTIDPSACFQVLVGILAAAFTWRCATIDIDLATGERLVPERLLLIGSAIGVWFYPGFLILLLFTGINRLRGWHHHHHLLVRLLLVSLSCWSAQLLLSVIVSPWLGGAVIAPITLPALFVMLLFTASHYFIPGLEKLKLGAHWYSWAWNNQLHHLGISAYMWGWCRFLPERVAVRIARGLRPFDRPSQVFTQLFELGSILILFQPFAAYAFLGSAFAFHVVSVVVAGILFWQSMVVTAALSGALMFLPPQAVEQLFGIESGLLFAALLVVHSWVGWIVGSPAKLAWWDTPFIARVDWTVTGESGAVYGLYNDFMDPNDRIFGNKLGLLVAPRKRINKHSGTAKSREQVDAILAAGGDPERIGQAIERLGVDAYKERVAEHHDRYLVEFFEGFNRGRRKRGFPRWLKAPRGQLYFWGRRPAFRGQERVREIQLRFREEVFDGERIVLIRDELLRSLPLGTVSSEPEAATALQQIF